MKTRLNFAIIFNWRQRGALASLSSSPNVRRLYVPALATMKKEVEREAMAIEVFHPLSSRLMSSTGVQIRPKKMTAIWKVDSNWASLIRKISHT